MPRKTRLPVLVAGVLALCWIAGPSAAAGDDEPARGPAAAEQGLLRSLEASQLAGDLRSRRAVLTATLEKATPGSELHAILRWVLAAESNAAMPTPAPRDRGLLMLAARHLTVPTPSSWQGALIAELGSDPGRDQGRDSALLEWIAKLPLPDSRECLRALIDRHEATALRPRVLAKALNQLGFRGALADYEAVSRYRRRREAELSHFGATASARILSTASRLRPGTAWAELHRREARKNGFHPGLVVDAATGLIRDGILGDAPESLLNQALLATHGQTSTGALATAVDARLGLALLAALDDDLEGAARLAAEAAQLPREPLIREDVLHIARLKARLVEGLFRQMAGEDRREFFEARLLEHGSLLEFSPLDRAWWGRGGPEALSRVLRQHGGADGFRHAAEVLMQAIDDTGSATHYGLVGRPDDLEERPVSWIFLQVARLQLEDAGDPALALATLRARVPALEQLNGWGNQDLLANARLLEARLHLHLGAADDALRAAAAGLDIAGGLVHAQAEASIFNIAQRQLPQPPAGVILWSARGYYSPLLARAHLTRANLEATLRHDPLAAARALFRAGEHLDWTGDRWLSTALDHARRGSLILAERALACVEPFPDRLYDRACVATYCGRHDEAIQFLQQHLRQRIYTARGRHLEIASMARDPDLAALRTRPDFPKNHSSRSP